MPYTKTAGPSSRAVYGVGLRPLACWDRGFESRRGHGCLSVVSVGCCQVEVSATGWSLVQRSPTDCDASLCDLESSWMRRPWPALGRSATGKKKYKNLGLRFKCCNFLYSRHQKVLKSNKKQIVKLTGWFMGVYCGGVWKILWWNHYFRARPHCVTSEQPVLFVVTATETPRLTCCLHMYFQRRMDDHELITPRIQEIWVSYLARNLTVHPRLVALEFSVNKVALG